MDENQDGEMSQHDLNSPERAEQILQGMIDRELCIRQVMHELNLLKPPDGPGVFIPAFPGAEAFLPGDEELDRQLTMDEAAAGVFGRGNNPTSPSATRVDLDSLDVHSATVVQVNGTVVEVSSDLNALQLVSLLLRGADKVTRAIEQEKILAQNGADADGIFSK